MPFTEAAHTGKCSSALWTLLSPSGQIFSLFPPSSRFSFCSFEDDYEVDTPEQAVSPPREASAHMRESFGRDSMESSRLDPPDDEPPSLKKGSVEEAGGTDPHFRSADYSISSPAAGEPSIDDQGFFSVAEAPLEVSASQVMMGTESVSNKYVSPESTSASNHHYFHDDRQRMMPSHDLESPLNSDHPQYAEDEAMYMNDEVAENGDSAYSQRHEFVDRGLGPSSPQERFEHSAGSPITGGSNNKFFDAESSLNGGSNQFSGMVDHRYQTEQPIPTQHTVGHAHDPYDGTEEKKYGVEVEEYDSQLENSSDMVKVGHTFQTGPPPQIDPNVDLSSPQSFESLSQQSPAMRGAHEILKRNRRRRLEVYVPASSHMQSDSTPTFPGSLLTMLHAFVSADFPTGHHLQSNDQLPQPLQRPAWTAKALVPLTILARTILVLPCQALLFGPILRVQVIGALAVP